MWRELLWMRFGQKVILIEKIKFWASKSRFDRPSSWRTFYGGVHRKSANIVQVMGARKLAGRSPHKSAAFSG